MGAGSLGMFGSPMAHRLAGPITVAASLFARGRTGLRLSLLQVT